MPRSPTPAVELADPGEVRSPLLIYIVQDQSDLEEEAREKIAKAIRTHFEILAN